MRSGGFFDYDAKKERLEEVERELENPEVWNDPERAQALGRERASLDKNVNGIRSLFMPAYRWLAKRERTVTLEALQASFLPVRPPRGSSA